MRSAFLDLVDAIPAIGQQWHGERILANSARNAPSIDHTVRELRAFGSGDAIVISAGPSLYRLGALARLRALDYRGVVIAVDGAYLQCLRAGIVPDYVVTLDPHPTRIVRWFGDPEYAAHSAGDDYFARQDLDEGMRADAEATNARNIELVDAHMSGPRLVICTAAPANVVLRTAPMRRYWFAPLVDDPSRPGSLTRRIAEITHAPALNTGGTVGTAAVVFADRVLRAERIAVLGMDLGYAVDMPLERTQSWPMLRERDNPEQYYPRVVHPVWGECYTDPTYAWYRRNLLELLHSARRTIYNCSGAGALHGARVECLSLEAFAHG